MKLPYILFCAAALVCFSSPRAALGGTFILDANTDLAAYSVGEPVTLYVDLTNSTAFPLNGVVNVSIAHLGYVSSNLPAQSIANLNGNATATLVFQWLPPATNYQGYLVSVCLLNSGGTVMDAASSAIDVSSDWSKFPRYGYVAHYDAGLDAYNVMGNLKNYHLNGIQFYDWQWKHHLPYTNGAVWPDVANRLIVRATLTNMISAAHAYSMLAMNYNSYGMAYSNYLTDGSGVTLSMGIFSASNAIPANQLGYGLPGSWATPELCEMNNRDTNWQNYICGREQAVFAGFAFDGWQIDTVGQHTACDFSGASFSLDDFNPPFINHARATLGRRMVFNTVDAGGENQVAQYANVDFLYSELWSGNPNYLSFQQRVDNVRSYGSKALVMPAYLNYGLTTGYFNEASVRLADAAMFAAGGSHLELGDGNHLLHNEYFPSDTNVLMSASLKAALHSYYDFLVGYENLLRGDTVSASIGAALPGVVGSTNAAPGTVWLLSKQTFGCRILHLINFLNNTSSAWQDTNAVYLAPPLLTNLAVKMYYRGALNGGKLWYATPDTNLGTPTPLNYATGSDANGNYVAFTVPQLQYWDMIWLEIKGTTSAGNPIPAANFDSMAGIGTEITADTGGGEDVGFVNNTNGDSYVAFNNIDFGAGAASVSARVASAVAEGTVEFHLDSPAGPLIATVPVGNTGGWQTWQTATAPAAGASGVHALFAVFKNAPSNLNWFTFAVPVPAPWLTTDVGSVGLAGDALYAGGQFTVDGSGADIEGQADAFRYVYQGIDGKCELRAQVAGIHATDPWAKAGVMIRESLASNAPNAAVVITAGNGVEFQRRSVAGGETTATVIAGQPAPAWVRLVRSAGNSFAGYYSADGTNWIQVGTNMAVAMSNNATAGLAVTAHNNTLLNSATFSSVALNQPPVLAAIPNQTLLAGATLTLTNAAVDPDVPFQLLAFSLLNPPTGATLNAADGILTWRPTIAQSPSTQTVTVTVSDNGVPPLSATQSFWVTVARPASPHLSLAALTNGQFGFWINGDPGPDYTIQVSTNLGSWLSVATAGAPTLPFFWMNTNPALSPACFYRAFLGP